MGNGVEEILDKEFFANFFEGTNIRVTEENVIHLTHERKDIASIHPESKYADFNEPYNDPGMHGPELRALTESLREKGYNLNLK